MGRLVGLGGAASSDRVRPDRVRPTVSLVAGVCACLLVASCGGGPALGDLTPAASDPPTTSAASPTHTSRANDAAILAEHEDKMVACFKDQGLTVTRTEQGWDVDSGGDRDLFQRVIELCADKVGPPPIQPPTAAEASQMFDLTVRAAQCLRDRGVEVGDPPSRESWVDTFLAGDPPWSPYDSRSITAADEAACPQPQLTDLADFDGSPTAGRSL